MSRCIYKEVYTLRNDWIPTIYFSVKIQAYVEDDNDILFEDDIVKSVGFNGCIYGTTSVVVDKVNLFGKIALTGFLPM